MDMAKRKYSKMSKIQPAVQTLNFVTPTVQVNKSNTFYIDLSQCVSLMNRRFYRQGLNWAVSNIKVTASQGGISIQKLPNTWVMSNAWEKSFRAWQQMIKNATDEAGAESLKGKFLDFKIYADLNHHHAGFTSNLLPTSFDGSSGTQYTAVPGQWDPATILIPSTLAPGSAIPFDLIAVGPNDPGVSPVSGNNAKSIIQGYADSRALPSEQDPNVPVDAPANWMTALFNDGTLQDGAVQQDLIETGDKPPYPFENDGFHIDTMYPGGETNIPTLQTHDIHLVTGTTIGGMTNLKGGNFPCGLVAVTWSPTADTSGIRIQLDLVPGTHRGYLCEPMTEM